MFYRYFCFKSDAWLIVLGFVLSTTRSQKCAFNLGLYLYVFQACDGKLYEVEGTLESQGYPDGYQNYLNCRMEVIETSQSTLTLIIDEMDIEMSEGCVYDALRVSQERQSVSYSKHMLRLSL